jgi:SnoaL-like domain
VVDAARLADDFLDAWTHKEFERARSLLHNDLSFSGPIDTFSDADTYLASLRQLSDIVTGTEQRKAFVDGDDACIIYDLHTTAVPTARVCEWFRVRDGRIASISVVFDARPFAAMFASSPDSTR